MLQTKDYAEAVFRAYKPTAPEAEIDELVTARLERGHLLGDPTTPLLWAVLEHLQDDPVSPGQLRHVPQRFRHHRAAPDHTAEYGLVPYDAGAHAAMEGSLKLMEFEDAPPLSFVEGVDMGKLLDDPATVARHTLVFNLLQAAALSPHKSLALIETVAQDYAHGAEHR
ncbi:DUF5753 domain-containing protein [Streptomyces anandii]|uniref:DUF5753 domain-containing protein n=1 Tax=Streptomyces anandii TaxID=285454 RepID=UPI0036979BE4